MSRRPKWFRRRQRLRQDRAAQRAAGTWVPENQRPGYRLLLIDLNETCPAGHAVTFNPGGLMLGQIVTATTTEGDWRSLAKVYDIDGRFVALTVDDLDGVCDCDAAYAET